MHSQLARVLSPSASWGVALLLVGLTLAAPHTAQAFTPTADDRFLRAEMAQPTETATPVPFQPFNDFRQALSAGLPIVRASQTSSFLVDGVTGNGSAEVFFAIGLDVESDLDVGFELAESASFQLEGDVSGGATFLLERISPNPAVLISTAGPATAFDQLAGLPVGTYRLRAYASGGGSFDIDFRRVCSAPNPLDTDGDEFADACDICPLDFDPDQADTDGDGIGDACNGAVDADGDDWADSLDNCPAIFNPSQGDADFDTLGDACDVPEVITEMLDPTGLNIFNPNRLAQAADGTVFVAGASSSNVFRISPTGGVVELFMGVPVGANVRDVAVSPTGFVYTAGGAVADCYKIDATTGAATLILGAQGDGQGAVLTYANAVAAAADGRVFVSGRDSENVFEVAVDGTVVEVMDASGDGNVTLGTPAALDVDAAGNLYVLGDDGSSGTSVFRVTPSHQVELVSTSFPLNLQAFDLALGPDGSVYVAGNGISAWRPSGQIDEVLPVSDPRSALAIDVDALGVVHVVEQFGDEAFRVTPSGEIADLIDANGDGMGNLLDGPEDIAVLDGPTKRIVIVSRDSKNVFLISDEPPAVVPLAGPWPRVALAFLLLLFGAPAMAPRARGWMISRGA